MSSHRLTSFRVIFPPWAKGLVVACVVAIALGLHLPHHATAGNSLAAPPPPVRPALVIEEYRIVDLDSVDLSTFELPMQLPGEIESVRAAWREQNTAGQIASANEKLKPFGYRYVATPKDWGGNASLYQGDKLVVANAGLPYRIAINDNKTDFAMVIENTPNIRPFQLLVSKAGMVPYDPIKHALTLPAFHGNKLLVLDADIGAVPVGEQVLFQVKRNGEVIYQDMMPPVYVENPMKALWGWDGHWVVEVADRLIWDGFDITQMGDVDKAYEFNIIQNQPFYFFERAGQVGISYATWEYPQRYDEVWHYRCCSDGAFNPRSNDRMVSFWARKDNAWWYVEAGMYQ